MRPKKPLKSTPMEKKATTYKRKTAKAPTLEEDGKPKSVAALPDFFSHTDAGGKDKLAHDTEILIMEWAFFFPNHSPTAYLQQVKGYSITQVRDIFSIVAAEDWHSRRKMAQDKLSGELIRRHIDQMAQVQDQHISASKLGLAQAVKMLAEGKTEIMRGKDGKPILNKDGTPKFKTFRSIDLLNCMSSIEKAQQIYRRAMGLPNDEGGLQQILNKLERMREAAPTTFINLTQNVQNNTAVKVEQTIKTGQPTDLGYEDIMALIEIKREQKKKLIQDEDERLKITSKEGVPTGNFTAAKK